MFDVCDAKDYVTVAPFINACINRLSIELNSAIVYVLCKGEEKLYNVIIILLFEFNSPVF